MLSYLHGFHAGNFADVHKHHLLVCLLRALNRKPKPWSYLETHAGKARYDLNDAQALKTAEFQQGIARLWPVERLSESLQAYRDQVQHFNPTESLQFYPGSPALAAALAPEGSNIQLMELHPNEALALRQEFRQQAQVSVHHRDGYEGVLACLPPKPNRGVVLIDPSYEVKEEYQQVVDFIKAAYKRWPNGCFAIWYPILPAKRWVGMLEALRRTGIPHQLSSEVLVRQPSEQGMYGSGMLIINPPWQLQEELEATLPDLIQLLAQDAGAEGQVVMRVPEKSTRA